MTAEDGADPLAALAFPGHRRGQPGPLPVLPAARRPPPRIVVPAVGDERGIGGVADRRRVDEERPHVDGVGRPFVVQRPGLTGRAHRERATRHHDLSRQAERVGRRGRGQRRGQHRRSLPELVGDQHRLVVLLLVLHDHAERETVIGERCPGEPGPGHNVEHPAADVGRVRAGLARREQRQRRPLRPGVLERVVQRVDLRVDRVLAANRAQQPHLLLIGDVRQVPDQRGHQRRMLQDQVGLVHAVGQRGRAVPRGDQRGGDLAAQGLCSFGGHCIPSSRSSAGHRRLST